MPSPKLERVKARNRALSDFLDKMAGYVFQQISSGERFVVPKLAAAVLNINEGEAFVLLKILAEGGVLQQVYNIYCRPTGIYLTTVASLDQLDDVDKIPYCDDCDFQHEPQDLTVEIAFRPKNGLMDAGQAA
jgi:hypothetical protein